jgi:hypothetical protein
MTDILQRVENMLGDCSIGPMRTLKTDDLTRVLYDAHDEIERLRAREARLREALDGVIRIADRDCPEFRAALEEEKPLGDKDK